MVSVTSASRYVTSASTYQSRSAMYIQGLIPRHFTESAEALWIACMHFLEGLSGTTCRNKMYKNVLHLDDAVP